MRDKTIELFASQVNCAVAHLSTRQYPGVVIQGDTLKTIEDTLVEAENCNELSEVHEIVADLRENVREFLNFYEATLASSGIELPYSV